MPRKIKLRPPSSKRAPGRIAPSKEPAEPAQAASGGKKKMSDPGDFLQRSDLDFAAAGMFGMVALVLDRRTKGAQ
jgi:hypothetical protein